jgi:hypothetical protein
MAALEGNLDAVLGAVGPDYAGVVGGSPKGPLLGHAAWVGDPEVVRRLLEAGADPAANAEAEFATPLAVGARLGVWGQPGGLRRGRRVTGGRRERDRASVPRVCRGAALRLAGS